MSTVITTTSGSNQAWTIPSNLVAGDIVRVEAWGAGSGGSGGNTSNRAGGAGGAYTVLAYTILAADITATTIAFFMNAGGAGSASASSTAGPDTWFKSNSTLLAKG